MSLELKGFDHKHGRAVLEQCFEFINRQTNLPDNSPESSFCYFIMVRHNNAPVRMRCLSEDDMTATLAILLIAKFFVRL
jgi:hypothetical protein